MTQNEIMEIGIKANLCDEYGTINWEYDYREEIIAFAKLVAAKERNRAWTKDDWTEYEHSIAAKEREACAKMVMPLDESLADKIRARK